jgi:hypothetical protein
MRRELGQFSLADGLVDSGAGRNRQLEKIAALVDWAAFARLLGEVYAAPVGGRPTDRCSCSNASCCNSGTGCPTRSLKRPYWTA